MAESYPDPDRHPRPARKPDPPARSDTSLFLLGCGALLVIALLMIVLIISFVRSGANESSPTPTPGSSTGTHMVVTAGQQKITIL